MNRIAAGKLLQNPTEPTITNYRIDGRRENAVRHLLHIVPRI